MYRKRILKHRLNKRYYLYWQRILQYFVGDTSKTGLSCQHYIIQRMCRF